MEIKTHYASLSEAIRAGAKIRPQTTGSYLFDGKSCAWGAGLEATFGLTADGDIPVKSLSAIFDAYPYLRTAEPVCCHLPCDMSVEVGYEAMVVHLNDEHHWTREAIADWLETEEEKLGYVTLIESADKLETRESVQERVLV